MGSNLWVLQEGASLPPQRLKEVAQWMGGVEVEAPALQKPQDFR